MMKAITAFTILALDVYLIIKWKIPWHEIIATIVISAALYFYADAYAKRESK